MPESSPPDAPPIARRGASTWLRVTDACNAHCTFCAQHVPRLTDDLRDDRAMARLQALLAGGVPDELLLTGGEPTLHVGLDRLVGAAIDAGVKDVVLYTNGMALADPRRLKALVHAGLTTARVSLFATEEAAAATLTRHPRAWPLAARGIDAAVDAGLQLELATVVHAGTAPHISSLGLEVARRWPQARRFVVTPYTARPPMAPPKLHVAPRDVEPLLSSLMASLGAVGIPASPDRGYGYHLCAFSRPRAITSLLRRGEPSGGGTLIRLSGCEQCVLLDRCGGVERTMADALGERVIVPITDVRRATWLPVHERSEASVRNDRIAVTEQRGERQFVREQVIRILHACNQRCAFCWVDFDAPAMTLEQVRAAITDNLERAQGQPVTISLTGGEPTMHPQLIAIVEMARALGAARVHMQTNAVRCANQAMARQLAAAGVDEALVSLHGADPSASDTLTAAPGTHARTVQGIRNLCEAGVDVVINHVLTATLARDFPEFVRFLRDQLAHPRLVLSLAVAGHIDRGPLDAQVLPRMSALREPVLRGLRLARSMGLEVRDLVHPCGIPPCVLDGDPEIFPIAAMREVANPAGGGDEGCVKPASCRRCVYDRYCFGVRREYAAAHGTDELRPVEEPGA